MDPFVASVTHKHSGIKVWNFLIPKITLEYSIVKGCSADLGVNSKIVQIRPTVKAVSTKISKKIFCIFVNILTFLRANREASFFLI